MKLREYIFLSLWIAGIVVPDLHAWPEPQEQGTGKKSAETQAPKENQKARQKRQKDRKSVV